MLGLSRSRVSAVLSSGPERLSSTPRTPNTPYVRPQFPTHGATHPASSGIGSSQPAGGNSQGRQQLGDARRTLEMQQKYSKYDVGEKSVEISKIRKVAQQVSKLEEQKKFQEMVKQQSETSVYKVR